MSTILNLILLQIIIVFIIDLSGIVPHIKTFISSYLTNHKIKSSDFSFKPFDCSLCMMHWVGLIYIICIGFTIPLYCLVCILSLFTAPMSNLLLTIIDKINSKL